MAPGLTNKQTAEQDDGDHQAGYHEQQGVAQLAKALVVAGIDVDVVLHDGGEGVGQRLLQGGEPHHDLLIIRCTRFQHGQLGFQLPDVVLGQLDQSQRLLIVCQALAQLAAQQDRGAAPENVVAQQQGLMVDPAVMVDLHGIEKAPQLELELHQGPGDVVGVLLHHPGRILYLHQTIQGATREQQNG
ncbi:hypothetical protein D3C85_910530 [compost metagenome]